MKFSLEKGRTDGWQHILELGLDSETIANQILKVYEKTLARDLVKKTSANRHSINLTFLHS